jgi:hypothetical protein
MNKNRFLIDNFEMKDSSTLSTPPHSPFRKTEVTFYVAGTDKVIWKGSNRSVLGGAPFTAYDQFEITDPSGYDLRECMVNYDYFSTDGGTDDSSIFKLADTEVLNTQEAKINESKCYLWCIGKGGTVSNPTQLIANEFASWIWPTDLIPFRTLKDPIGTGSNEDLIGKYYGSRYIAGVTDSDQTYYAYYFKKITNASAKVRINGDGYSITDAVADSSAIKKQLESRYRAKHGLGVPEDTNNLGLRYYNTHETEFYTELKLSITTTELREWFLITDNDNVNPDNTPLSSAIVDSLSLCQATPIYNKDDYTKPVAFKNITPMTKLNFYSENIGDLDKGIDIVYQLYY